jgi:hypothetical protein
VAYRGAAVTARFGAARVAALGAASRAGLERFGAPQFGGARTFAAHERVGAPVRVLRGPTRAEAEFRHGPVGRGPGPVRGGARPVAPAHFSPGGAPHGGPGGAPHGGGPGGHHH